MPNKNDSLPYEKATSGKRALLEIESTLQKLGCESFGSMFNYAEKKLLLQFTYRNHQVSVEASAKGYAQAWLKKHPYTFATRASKKEHEEKALAIGEKAVYSCLRDWIKGQVMAIETGILSVEGAFLGQIMLPSGKTVLQAVEEEGRLQLEHKHNENEP